MAKQFNYTGLCIPEKHFMADTSAKIDDIMKLIDAGKYFTINRPRQFGKTTTLHLLEQKLEETGYLPVFISFEGIGDEPFEDEKLFPSVFMRLIRREVKKEIPMDPAGITAMESLEDLDEYISDFVDGLSKKIVLFIDEVDASGNHELFLRFIGMLRDKYLRSERGRDTTFHSVILVGVHDVKNLKLKIRGEGDGQFNSPWNIAADFKVDLALSAKEIASMLEDFSGEKGVSMDIPVISELLFYYTSGYPFLVSKLCYIIDEVFDRPQPDRWDTEDIYEGVKYILREENTNFDSLFKNLENNRELYNLVYDIVIEGAEKNYNMDNPAIQLGTTYGIFKRDTTILAIHNRVYEQRIYNYMASKIETSMSMDGYNTSSIFILPGNKLDFEKVLTRFQRFMKEQYSKKDTGFLERNGRLIFLAFLKPIINGRGFDFKEVQISEEKRLDIVVTYGREKYIIELKVWRGGQAHQAGIRQLAGYLDRQNCDTGYLVIFDPTEKKEWKQDTISEEGKSIFAVWV